MMETLYMLLFITLAFIALGVFLYQKKAEARMLAATYMMYAVRDEFVLLVAKGIVKEGDPLFSHYYDRINALITMAPDIGVDSLLEKILRTKIQDYEKGIAAVRKKMDEIESSETMKIKEVRCAVEKYYAAMAEMILSHSNILRFYYIHLKHLRWADHILDRITPFRLQPAIKTVQEFSQDRADRRAAA